MIPDLFSPRQLCSGMASTSLRLVQPRLEECVSRAMDQRPHGDLQKWADIIRGLPPVYVTRTDLNAGAVKLGDINDCSDSTRAAVRQSFYEFHPWRKGPFNVVGLEIDAEWRSDWKWSRLGLSENSLDGKSILDIGCGNGYYLMRMLGAGARSVLGIDPTWLFVAQLQALRRYSPDLNGWVLPLKSEELPLAALSLRESAFDMVFSMGILYHRRDPVGHLLEARQCLQPGGEFILETLVIPGDESTELVPEKRYAKMRNVWGIPTVTRLKEQLALAGFKDTEVVDITVTSISEQRRTKWMTFESLEHFLCPSDPTLTIEGYPSPMRAMLRCRA